MSDPSTPAPYDSRPDTYDHIAKVNALLVNAAGLLLARGLDHDRSKLREPELSAYNALTPRLKNLTYGSDEYRATLSEMKSAIDHHYSVNPHHPEYWPNGIQDMSLLDLVEMLCDWSAAARRSGPGTVNLTLNQDRFGYGPELQSIFKNTLRTLGVDFQ